MPRYLADDDTMVPLPREACAWREALAVAVTVFVVIELALVLAR